jgi:hypothetical protein
MGLRKKGARDRAMARIRARAGGRVRMVGNKKKE